MVPLDKAVQGLSVQNEALVSRIDQLEALVNKLLGQDEKPFSLK